VKSIDKSEPLYIYKLVQKERKRSSEDSKSSDTGSKIMDEVESKIIDNNSPEISDIDDLNKDVTKSHDIEYMSCDKTDTCVDTNSREDNMEMPCEKTDKRVDTNSREDNTEMSCEKNDTSVDTNCQEDNMEMPCEKTDKCVDTNSQEDNTEMSGEKNDTSVDTNCQEDNTKMARAMVFNATFKTDTPVDTNCQEDNMEQQNCVLHSEENVESKSNRKSDIQNATKTVFSDHIEI
jgi:hypothetical protein